MAAGPTSRYRKAYNAGAAGSVLPGGLASMADEDPLIDLAHDAGRNGVPFSDFAAEHGLTGEPARGGGAGRSAPTPRRAGRRSGSARSPYKLPSRRSPSFTRPGSGIGASLAGVALGMIAYALVLSVVEYGAAGPLLWFKAKFLNEPALPPTDIQGQTVMPGAQPIPRAGAPGTIPFGGVGAPNVFAKGGPS